ncbi:MAG TPA: glycosyltransferase family 10 [Micropepsaceae bacterium]|nr:glycosyltransferase family 10 [Micropepsaceae bacterium]
MKPQIRVAFAYFWPGFTPEHFRSFFPFVYEKYELVPSNDPEIVFYSVFSPQFRPYADAREIHPVARVPAGKYLRVFITGENFEPDMANCEFSMTFSALVDHPNHFRLPLWVYENRGWGFTPDRLVKDASIDWEKVAAGKTAFCNYVYLHEVPFRDAIFRTLSAYKRVDSAGRHLNNMNGWMVPYAPNRVVGKVEFFHRYKFTLAAENMIWPGYMTEKLVDPMYVNSIPIYVGDPLAKGSFDPASYIDFSCFPNMKQMMEFVRAVDNDNDLYMKMLAAPFYRENAIPDYARDENILVFFDRIAAAALARRR